jgi:DNA-binding transcriptional regulator YbjK
MTRVSAEDRRDALIEAAIRVIAAKGVTAATTRAIVAEAGASLASFHYAFRSRDEMMAELITVVTTQEAESVVHALVPAETIEETLEAGFQAYMNVVRSDPSREQAMLELNQYALRTPGLEHLAREQYRTYFAVAEQILAAGVESGGLVWTRPLPELARLLITITDGLTTTWLADRDDAATDAVIRDAVDLIARYAVASPQKENR